MRLENFLYWWMGAYELGRCGTTSFSNDQIRILVNHANLVLAYDTSPREGPGWTLLLKVKQVWDLGGQSPMLFIPVFQFSLVAELKECFKHEIDPQAGPEQVQFALNEIHSGGSSNSPESTVMRC